MKYSDFSGYSIAAPTRKNDFPKGILYMALGDCDPKDDAPDDFDPETIRFQEVYTIQIKEIRYIGADVRPEYLPADPSYFHDEVVDKNKLGYDFAIYGWAEAGRGVETRIIEKATKAFEEWDL